MKYVQGLRCRECGRDYPVAPTHVCEFCFGPLEVSYDLEAISGVVSRESIAAGPATMWRYAPLLPDPEGWRVDIGAGWSRMRRAPRLAAELGLRDLWVKTEGTNPTHSFKDRVVSVALSVARSFGFEVAACPSTGNLANAVAAHAAASGMQSVVFIPSDLEAGKVGATIVYGGVVLAVDGGYDDVNRLSAELADSHPWAFVNVNVRPYYAEGSKTLGFEIAEQLGWRSPDVVVTPIASGSLMTKIGKGLRELHTVGLLDDAPHTTIHGAQAEGCSPVAQAFAAGEDEVRPVRADTIAKSLAIGTPADGYYAIEEARRTGGRIEAVPEASIAEGMRLLARTEGLFTETAGGVTVSALEQLVRAGAVDPDDEVVVLITGIGLKTLEALGPLNPTRTIAADVAAVDDVMEAIAREEPR
ncbi:MAG TPA: threonine synthase [Actinomycetota bacterium]|nr:threonine synthase [Actinomycetota bacterium]